MPWVTRRELARLERERGQAIERAEAAEDRLAEERQRHDWLSLQLLNRAVTKHGGYGLDHEPPPVVEPVAHPQGYTHDPTEIDLAKLDYYRQCAVQAGKDPEDGERIWEAEMRGESLPIESDSEN